MAEKTASLTVLGGDFAGRRCPLPESGTVTVGSAAGSTLRLEVPTVAPYHARIEVAAGRVVVHDTGAERALHVNDSPLDPGGTVLCNGDILWLGAPGEDDVVMLQCVLPRRGAEPASPSAASPAPGEPPTAPPRRTVSGPAVPTPDVETQALWSLPDALGTEPLARVEAEPAREEPTGHEETMALFAQSLAMPEAEGEAEGGGAAVVEVSAEPEVAGEAPAGGERLSQERPGDELVFAPPRLAGASERELDIPPEIAEGQEVVFGEEPEGVPSDGPETVAFAAETPPPPTVLIASVEEFAEPQAVAIDFGEGVVEPPAAAAPDGVEPAPAAPQTVDTAPFVEPAPEPAPAVVAASTAPPPAPHANPPPLPGGHAPQPASPKARSSVPPLPAAPPVAPPRAPTPRPVPGADAPARPRPARYSARGRAQHAAARASANAAPHPGRPPSRPAPSVPPRAEAGDAEPEAPRAGRRTAMLALAGAGGALLIAALAWVAWRVLAGSASAPGPEPTPVVQATTPPVTVASPEPTVPIEPTPQAELATPAPSETEAPSPSPTARATPSPTPPSPTPSPRPTPAAARPTPTPPAARPTPTPAGPTPDALAAQQKAAEAQALLAQAETALGARQYDAAVTHLDGALRLEPGNARATALRVDAVRRGDAARRRFAPGRTVVQGRKAQQGGSLAGFDTDDADLRRAPDFLGRVDFEMTPSSGIEPGDAWTLRVYVVNEGKKAIRVNGLVLGTTVNATGSGGPLSPRVREIAPQQRSLVAETRGTWAEGTTSWVTEVTVSGGRGESLRNTITWR